MVREELPPLPLGAPLGHGSAAEFLRQISQSSAPIVRVARRDEDRAAAIIFQYQDKDFSLTHASSFAVMERLQIRAAFTSDRNFAQYGLTMIGG